MRKSILLLLLASIASIFAAGCASGPVPNVAFQFEPRVYPYVPEMGPDGPTGAGEAK